MLNKNEFFYSNRSTRMLQIKSILKGILKRILLILSGLKKGILKILLVRFIKNIKTYRAKRYEQKIFSKKRLDNLKCEILKYYSTLPQYKMSIELSTAVDFLKHKPVTYFPCNLTRKYGPQMVHLTSDQETKLNFALINGKRMFFKRDWTENKCIEYCYSILEEQDENSPHRYLSESFTVKTDDIVVDVGAAEGIFSLDVIERASKIYLFEVDSGWTEALEATFAPWKEKVEIVNKYLSDYDSEDHKSIALDNFFQNKK